MLGFRFLKASPSTYVIHYSNGRIRHQGVGLSFFYYEPATSLIAVPVNSADTPFAFSEMTSDFQPITLQGQLAWRIADPIKLASQLDFAIDAKGRYRSEDQELLRQRLANLVQIEARAVVGRMELRRALVHSEEIVERVLASLRASPVPKMLGVEILGLAIVSIRATPETTRALEAEARESLLRVADDAIYDRRNSAVEQERRIRENELKTEIAVEEKRRQIRETQMAAEIAVEKQRSDLIGKKMENDRKEAETRAFALEATLKPLRDMDWKTLMAAHQGPADPGLMIALAFRELAENAHKIGELNVSPDLLQGLLTQKARKA